MLFDLIGLIMLTYFYMGGNMFGFLKRKVLNREEKEKVVSSTREKLKLDKKKFIELKTLSQKDIEEIEKSYQNNEIMLQDSYITSATKCMEECDNNIAIIDKCLANIEKQIKTNATVKSSKFIKYNEELEKVVNTLEDNYNKSLERRNKLLNDIVDDKQLTKEKKYKDQF